MVSRELIDVRSLNSMTQEHQAAIAGIYEWPKRVDPSVSSMQIKAASIKAALDDAGLSWSDVDGL